MISGNADTIKQSDRDSIVYWCICVRTVLFPRCLKDGSPAHLEYQESVCCSIGTRLIVGLCLRFRLPSLKKVGIEEERNYGNYFDVPSTIFSSLIVHVD